MMGWEEGKRRTEFKAFLIMPSACVTCTMSAEDEEEATVQLFYYVYNAKRLSMKGESEQPCIILLVMHLSREPFPLRVH